MLIRLIFIVSIIVNVLLLSLVQAEQKYKIEVSPVAVRNEPSKDAKVILSLYQANNVEILELAGKWAKVNIEKDANIVTGWVEKTDLKLPEKNYTQISQSPDYNVVHQDDSQQLHSEKLLQKGYKAWAISSDLHCINEKKNATVTGCVIDVDLEATGPEDAQSIEVSCKAVFDMLLIDESKRSHWLKKTIRTPLKQGKGAARVQMTVLPVLDTQLKNVEVTSYECQLEKIL